MSPAKKRNTAHSVFQRLLNHAKAHGFVRKSKPETVAGDLDVVIGDLASFLLPVVEAVRSDRHLELFWARHGPWGEIGQNL